MTGIAMLLMPMLSWPGLPALALKVVLEASLFNNFPATAVLQI